MHKRNNLSSHRRKLVSCPGSSPVRVYAFSQRRTFVILVPTYYLGLRASSCVTFVPETYATGASSAPKLMQFSKLDFGSSLIALAPTSYQYNLHLAWGRSSCFSSPFNTCIEYCSSGFPARFRFRLQRDREMICRLSAGSEAAAFQRVQKLLILKPERRNH